MILKNNQIKKFLLLLSNLLLGVAWVALKTEHHPMKSMIIVSIWVHWNENVMILMQILSLAAHWSEIVIILMNFCQWLHQSGAAIDKNVTKMITFLFHYNKIFQGVIAPHMQEHIDNIKLCTPRIYQIHMLISVLLCPCLELVYYSLDYYWYTFRSHAKFPWVLIHFTAVGGLLL